MRPIEDDKAGEELTLDDPAVLAREHRPRSVGERPTAGWRASTPRPGRSSAGRSTSRRAAAARSPPAKARCGCPTRSTTASIRADAKTARPVGDPIAVGGDDAQRDRGRRGRGLGAARRHRRRRHRVVPIDPAKNRAGRAIRDRHLLEHGGPGGRRGRRLVAGGEDAEPPGQGRSRQASSSTRAACASRTASRTSPSARAPSGCSTARADRHARRPRDDQAGRPADRGRRGRRAGSRSRPDAAWVLSPRRGALRITWDG